MSRSIDDRVTDIHTAVTRCIQYADRARTNDDELVQMAADAIERNIAVIGEAVTHLPNSVTDAIPEVDWAAIRGMRNVLVHAYFGVDSEIVRDVVHSKLKPLDEALERYVTGRL